MKRRNSELALGMMLTGLLILSGCGSTGATTALTSTSSSKNRGVMDEDKQVNQSLITSDEIAKTRAKSVERSFYEYWSAIEHHEWPVALQFFPSASRRALGVPSMIRALRVQGTQDHPVRPLIRSVRRAPGDQTSIRYFIRSDKGKLIPTSSQWRRIGSRWYILYNDTFDASYASAQQLAVQGRVDPNAATPSGQALSAYSRGLDRQASLLDKPR